MASGGVPSFSQLDERAGGAEEPAGGGSTSTQIVPGRVAALRIAPIYKRLPHGPNRLGRHEVAQNQRARIHGAMIEAVSERGYRKTSVAQVVALAGVSRRSFYELYANREEGFLTSLDLIAAGTAKHTNDAYKAAKGDVEDRLRAAFKQITKEIAGNSKRASLLLVEAPVAGGVGLSHLCSATATFEQMLLSGLTHASDGEAPPLAIVRGIVGGLQEVMSARLRSGRAKEIPALAEEMLQWTLRFQASAPDNLAAHLAERALVSLRSTNGHATNGHSVDGLSMNGHSSNGHATNGHATNGSSSNGHATNGNGHLNGDASNLDVRARLLESTIQLTVLPGSEALCVPRIADGAGVTIDSFFEQFEHVQECFTAAFDAMSDELLLVTADADLVGQDWPRGVRKAIGALMHHLASHPLHAQMIATGVCAVGPEAIERNYQLASDIAMLLTEGAPEGTGGTFAVEGVAGAIWHTVRRQVMSEQIQRLPALADYLAYVVLTPFIGGEAAAELITEDD
jgi:AcrR family transcriptional regulator